MIAATQPPTGEAPSTASMMGPRPAKTSNGEARLCSLETAKFAVQTFNTLPKVARKLPAAYHAVFHREASRLFVHHMMHKDAASAAQEQIPDAMLPNQPAGSLTSLPCQITHEFYVWTHWIVMYKHVQCTCRALHPNYVHTCKSGRQTDCGNH